jgi:hypothetical protein
MQRRNPAGRDAPTLCVLMRDSTERVATAAPRQTGIAGVLRWRRVGAAVHAMGSHAASHAVRPYYGQTHRSK